MREGQTNPNSIPFKKLSLPGTKLLEHTSRTSPSLGASTTSLSPPTSVEFTPNARPGSVPIMTDNISPDSMNPAERLGTHESKWREIQIDIRRDSPMILLRVGIIAKIPMFLQ